MFVSSNHMNERRESDVQFRTNDGNECGKIDRMPSRSTFTLKLSYWLFFVLKLDTKIRRFSLEGTTELLI